MAVSTIQFACSQCQKKFSIPSSFAGKTVTCGCGAKVVVPSPQSGAAVAGTMTSSAGGVGTTQLPTSPSHPVGGSPAQGTAVTSQSHIGVGPSSGSGAASRREFPALKFVATVTEIIAWLYIIGGIVVAVGIVVGNPMGNAGGSILFAILVGLAVLLIAVFIRAMAELIRLALYISELLEDVRSNTG